MPTFAAMPCPALARRLTPYQVMKIGRVPLIAHARPDAASVAEQVAELESAFGVRW